MRVYPLLILFFLIPISSAQDNIFDILNEKYILSINELPESTNLQPEKVWNPSWDWIKENCKRDRSPKFVFGWIDIIGYDRSIKKDDHIYLNEPAKSAAIIQYETYACVLGHQLFKGKMINKLETYEQDGQLVAKLTATQVLYRIVEEKYYYDNETRIFYDYEPLPLQYPQVPDSRINITEYNNSINPNTVIELSTDNSSSFINYTYKNESIKNYLKTARVEKTAKGVYFANVSSANIWTAGTDSFHQVNDKVIIRGTARPDYQNLTVQVSTIFENKKVSEYSVIRDTYTIGRSFGKVYIAVLVTFTGLIGIIVSIGRRTF